MEEDTRLLQIDLSVASPEVIGALIEDPSGRDIFDEIAKANLHRPDILGMLLDNPQTPENVRKIVAERLNQPTAGSGEPVGAERTKEFRKESLQQKVQRLNVSERVQLALKGGREIRGILARDPNKEVLLGILENGKITESEIEMMAKNRSALEEVLRRISKNREWMKKYPIVYALVTNPKTPPGVAVTFVSSLRVRDLTVLEKNKNLSEAVRIAAKKLLLARKP
jgi:hypothetical protein